MAALAGATELGGGLLTATGLADPAGPLAIIGAMTVASATHRANGPLAARGGFELPVTNLAAAAALAAAGPGRLRLGPSLPRPMAAAAFGAGGLLAALSLAKLAAAEKTSGGRPCPPSRSLTNPGRPLLPGNSSAGAEA